VARIIERAPRGKAGPDAQLSKLQRQILVWIFQCQSAGPVVWSAKRFMADTDAQSDRFTISRSLTALEKRELLLKLGSQPKIHVHLTKAGVRAAQFEIKHGRTQREWFDNFMDAIAFGKENFEGILKGLEECHELMKYHEHVLNALYENKGVIVDILSKYHSQAEYEDDFWKMFKTLETEIIAALDHLVLSPSSSREVALKAFSAFQCEKEQWLERIQDIDSTL
jgi:hypothetical protein